MRRNRTSYNIIFLHCNTPSAYTIANNDPFNGECTHEGYIDLLALIYDCDGTIQVRPQNCASNYVVANEYSGACDNSLFSPPIRRLKIQCTQNGTFLEGKVMFRARARRINMFTWTNAMVGSSTCINVLLRCDQYEDCKPTPVALVPVAGTEDNDMAFNDSPPKTNSLLSLNMDNYKKLFDKLLHQF